MLQTGRKYAISSSKYRYSINGQEKEVELNENITTAEFWEYDSRIIRRWNVDPKPNLSISPYSCFNGNPIFHSDPYGDTTILFNANNGRYMRTINDNLPNQSHFVNPTIMLLANFKGGVNKYALRLRRNSVAFIGKNTAEDAQAIEN